VARCAPPLGTKGESPAVDEMAALLLTVGLVASSCALMPGAALPRIPARASSSPLRATTAPSMGLLNFLKKPFRRYGDGESSGEPEIVCGETKYGCDPRGPDAFSDDDYTQPIVPKSAEKCFSIQPGVVGELTGGVGHLNKLLSEAGMERAVVLKFQRRGCPACKSTIEPLASAAIAYQGRADFATVDYDKSRAFCKSCSLFVVPCAHVYVEGQIVASLPFGPRAWGAFAEKLEELLGAPKGELLSPIIPKDKTKEGVAEPKLVRDLDMFE
jgi:thiol-disulfide isomerase/thioredoxin